MLRYAVIKFASYFKAKTIILIDWPIFLKPDNGISFLIQNSFS